MPAYLQLGNRVSSLVDVKVEKKIRMVRKNFSATVKLQLTQKVSGNVAPSNIPLKMGNTGASIVPYSPFLILILKTHATVSVGCVAIYNLK